MKGINLRMNEQSKYDVIVNVAQKKTSIKRASVLLNCTIRTVYNLLNKYRNEGKEGFVHGNRDRKPSTTFSEEIKKHIIDLYSSDTYDNANFAHFKELIERKENIKISYSALYSLLTSSNFLSPKCNRVTRTNYNKKLRAKINNHEKLDQNEMDYIAVTNLDDLVTSHPRKPRAKYSGELVQMDACETVWFGNKKCHLHAAIDDATGAILGAYFDHQETLNGYYHVFSQILYSYGIPAKFLTDRRTVFEYKRLKNPTDEKDTLTQFGYACSLLGVELETSSIPQVKGRIERLFNTLQSRLPVELRIAGITDIDNANAFLQTYIKEYNQHFSTTKYYTKHVFEMQIDSERINYCLSIVSPRKVDKGNSIKYKNKIYQFYNEKGLACIPPKTSCLVVKTYDDKLLACVGNDIYDLVELENNHKVSKNFDNKEEEKKKYTGHKPSYFHPWSYNAYKLKMKKFKRKSA